MPSPNQPNTLAILRAVAAQQSALTINGSNPAYTLVKIGSLGDTIDQSPWCTVEMHRGTSTHYAAGGRVDEKTVIRVTSGMPIMGPVTTADTTTVEEALVTIRDTMIPQYQQHSTLQGVFTVYTLIIVPDSEVWGYIWVNGVWHRIYQVDIKISAQYQLPQGVID